ncbi:MAG TPA: hypothetical protein VFW11_08345 [Cyclobacteriaceae bacterium]|nr:hypothetical protein [Cyclobacteriaceae bacterium]
MKTISSMAILLAVNSFSFAQSAQQSIEESEPGWYKIYHFKGAAEVKKLDNRVFSIAQLSVCDSLANWMQASYWPKAGIGDIKKNFFPKASPYSPYNVAWPQGYGATAYIWDVSYNAQGKLERIQETQTLWDISANLIPGWPIRDLSTTTRYYFTIPSFEGYDDVKKIQDLSNVPGLKPYITFWEKNIEAGNGTENVLLCKDNKSPFIRITKGEYLTLLEAAIPRAYEKEKKEIEEKNRGDQRSVEYFMKYLDEKNARRATCLKNNQAKYKTRSSETAEVFTPQPDIMLENYADIFEGNGGNSFRYPVYTIDPAVVELCKKDKPQWILVSWNWAPGSAKEKYMHESIINNFNFNYVYNFFFYPEKVKGQPYRPMRPPRAKEAVVVLAKSESSAKAALNKNVHFFEDFSTTAMGKKPNGWYAKAGGTGLSSIVTSIDGTPDKWVVIEGNSIIANSLTKPLPKNFTLSYDMMVPENFTWGAKGLVLLLSREKTAGVADAFIRLKLRPGSGGADGEAEFETKFPSGYANGTKWYVATGFSNNKKINRINVIIKKSGEDLQLLIDNKTIAEYDKGVPAELLFNALSFDMSRSDGETEKFYVSNIKITKE